jgi:hypothetical protein
VVTFGVYALAGTCVLVSFNSNPFEPDTLFIKSILHFT